MRSPDAEAREGHAAGSEMRERTELVRRVTGSRGARRIEQLATLWSGYGSIARYALEGGPAPTVVVKSVDPRRKQSHPRGFGSMRSHERKLASYAVERSFYDTYAPRCSGFSRVPKSFYTEQREARFLFVLEDLDQSGFAGRAERLNWPQVRSCLAWLAHFHANFLVDRTSGADLRPRCDGLWDVGTYWHLATRPDELGAMPDGPLKEAAALLDHRLREVRFSTLVHGDAKSQNFCFAEPTEQDFCCTESAEDDALASRGVAAVDFQYVGMGCAMKDVAYFLSSCYDERDCESHAERALDFYFETLRQALSTRVQRDEGWVARAEAVETEWRAMYPLAWADFVRFLLGWAPGHFKLHGYSLRMTKRALSCL